MNAGFWIRFAAILLDAIIVAVPLTIISIIISGGYRDEFITDIISFLYSLLLPVIWYGYTIGKRICGIRIRKLDGSPPGLGTMLMRNVVAAIVYVITLGIGLIISLFMVVFREDHRAIHDFIAGTEVVRD